MGDHNTDIVSGNEGSDQVTGRCRLR